MEELKNKIHLLFVVFCCSILPTGLAQNNTSLNLKKCIEIALKNNIDIYSAQFQYGNAKARLNQSQAAFLPTLSGFINQGISNGKSINPYTNTFINQEVSTGQYGLNASLNIFNGLNNINSVMQSYYAQKASRKDVEQTRIDICSQVTTTYIQVLNNEELLELAQVQLEATNEQIKRLNTLEKNGALALNILYETKGQLANDKVNLINAKAALLTAKLNLGQLLNMEISAATTFDKLDTELQLQAETLDGEKLHEETKSNSPMITSSNYKTKSALKNWRIAQGQIFPSIILVGSLGSNYSSAAILQKATQIADGPNGDYVTIGSTVSPVFTQQYNFTNEKIQFNNQLKNNLNTYIGLGVQIPIFNSLRTRTQIVAGRTGYELAKIQLKSTEIRFKSIIIQLSNDLNNALERYMIYNEQKNDYEKAYNVAQKRFESGAITPFEYINSKTNFERAKANLALSKHDYLLKKEIIALYKSNS